KPHRKTAQLSDIMEQGQSVNRRKNGQAGSQQGRKQRLPAPFPPSGGRAPEQSDPPGPHHGPGRPECAYRIHCEKSGPMERSQEKKEMEGQESGRKYRLSRTWVRKAVAARQFSGISEPKGE